MVVQKTCSENISLKSKAEVYTNTDPVRNGSMFYFFFFWGFFLRLVEVVKVHPDFVAERKRGEEKKP